jgi:hypothetical protein
VLFINVPIEENVSRLYKIRATKNKGMPTHRGVLRFQGLTAIRVHNLSSALQALTTVPNNANAASMHSAASIAIQLTLELSSTPKRWAKPMRSHTANRESPAVIRRILLNKLERDGFENIFGSFRLSVVWRPPHGWSPRHLLLYFRL